MNVSLKKDNWEKAISPIEKPFLLKSNFDDIQESLGVFKMVSLQKNKNFKFFHLEMFMLSFMNL